MAQDQFSFQVFNISQDRGIVMWAIVLANVLHHCMCKECGLHAAKDFSPIRHFRTNLIPSLKKGDKWSQKEINERDYCWFTLGQLVHMSLNEENISFWQWALSFKQDDINDTFIAIAKDARLAINIESQQSPLN